MQFLTSEEINSIYPVVGAVLYPGGLVVTRLNSGLFVPKKAGRARGEVKILSKRSLSRLAFLANCHKLKFLSLLTLTYGVNWPMTGRQVKSHLNQVLTRFRQVYGGGFGYIWFLEFQRRGAPHIHIITTLPGPSEGERLWYAGMWAGIGSCGLDVDYTKVVYTRSGIKPVCELNTVSALRYVHSRPEAWEGVRSQGGAARYVVKYATKPEQKVVPVGYRDVGRFWGNSRDLGVPDGEVVYGSESEIREFLLFKGRDMRYYDVLPKICLF